MMNLHRIFLLILLGLTLVNAGTSLSQSLSQKANKNAFPLHRLADNFIPLKSLFANQREAGYLTQKNTDDTPVIARYELAQFTLAPTVLQLNKANYPFVLIDAMSPQDAMEQVNAHGLTALKVDNTGLVLTVNKNVAPNSP